MKRTALAALTIVCAAQAIAQTSPSEPADKNSTRASVEYQLPSMPLQNALAAIQKRFNQKIQFEEAKLAGLRSQPVVGQHTAETAVAQALVGTGLGLLLDEPGVIKVVPGSVATLSTIVVAAKRDQAESDFKADFSSTSARSGLSLQETPAGVTIVTAQVIESQQARTLNDVLTNVSGVVVTPSSQGGQSFAIRGYNASLLSNGLAQTAESTSTSSGTPSVDEIQRVEVLKGPQAVLAGAGILGGAVNIVYKKPQADPIRNVKVRSGTYGDMGTSADLSGAFSEQDKRLTYRLIAVSDSSRTSLGGFDGRSESRISPALRYKDANTDITLIASSGRTHEAPNQWTTSVKGVIQPDLPRRTGNASDGITSRNQRFSVDLEQRLPYDITLISRLQKETETERTALWLPLALLSAQYSVVGFMGTNSSGSYDNLSGDHYLRGKFNIGPMSHNLVLGYGHVQSKRDVTYYSTSGFLPVVLSDPKEAFPAFGEQMTGKDHSVYHQTGVYVQDTIRWGDTSLVAGVRRNKSKDDGLVYTAAPGQGSSFSAKPNDSSNSSSSVGLVHAVTEDISLYALTAKGFKGNYGTWCGATSGSNSETGIKTMTTTNHELGAKFDLFGGNFSVTTGFFDLKQRNRPLYNASGRCNILIDGQETKGIDVDVQGQPLAGLNVIGNYTRSNTTDMNNSSTKFDGQPKYQSSLWSVYKLPWVKVQGMSVGLGVSFYGETTAGAAYSPLPVKIPAWSRVDTSLSYEAATWSASLGIKNLANKEIYGYSTNPLYIPVVSKGRTAVFTLGFRL